MAHILLFLFYLMVMEKVDKGGLCVCLLVCVCVCIQCCFVKLPVRTKCDHFAKSHVPSVMRGSGGRGVCAVTCVLLHVCKGEMREFVGFAAHWRK